MQKDIIIARPAKYVSRLDIYLEGGYNLIMDQNDFLGSATIISLILVQNFWMDQKITDQNCYSKPSILESRFLE